MESLHDPEHDKRVITADNVLKSFDAGLHPEAQHTGYYNDLDMMVMGMRGMTNSLRSLPHGNVGAFERSADGRLRPDASFSG